MKRDFLKECFRLISEEINVTKNHKESQIYLCDDKKTLIPPFPSTPYTSKAGSESRNLSAKERYCSEFWEETLLTNLDQGADLKTLNVMECCLVTLIYLQNSG